MTLTRWKLLAGVFGLSLCGLAALAEPACRTVGYTQRQLPENKPLPLPQSGGKPTPPPLDVPPPIPAPLTVEKVSANPPTPTVLPLPKFDPPPPSTEVPAPTPLPQPVPANPFAEAPKLPSPTLPEPRVVSGGMDEKSFVDLAKTQLKLPDLPTLERKEELKKPAPAPATPPVGFGQSEDLRKSTPVTPLTPQVLQNSTPVSTPPLPGPELPPPQQLVPATIAPTTEPVRVSATTTVAAERKLKVQLHLGGGKPWFEVRDGDELVLKVVSDAIEVKAPAENGDAASVLRASGAVSFRTLGGNGTCDELRVIPGTGEVMVSGKVQVTSNWGKAETTASADKMTFKLGGQVSGMAK